MEGLIPCPCPCCDGCGEVWVKTIRVYEHGCYVPHDDDVWERCDECDGTGEIFSECETAGEEWIIWAEHSQFGVGA